MLRGVTTLTTRVALVAGVAGTGTEFDSLLALAAAPLALAAATVAAGRVAPTGLAGLVTAFAAATRPVAGCPRGVPSFTGIGLVPRGVLVRGVLVRGVVFGCRLVECPALLAEVVLM